MAMATTTTIGIVGLVTAVLIHYLRRSSPALTKSDKFFSQDYFEARGKFRDAVLRHPSKMELHHLEIHVPEGHEKHHGSVLEDLTIDIGLLRRSKSKLLIHLSGTHGVEGFSGSSIQYSLLDNPQILNRDIDANTASGEEEDLPTLMFVHAVNPYGFANLRRFNENNVDLNRNFLSKDQFHEVMAQDPNHARYVDHMDLINPTESFVTKWDFYFLRVIYCAVIYGLDSLKETLVTGNYHFPNSMFFGGVELQPSYVKLNNFLAAHFDIPNMKEVGIIDVHTGLGPSGFDSLTNEGMTRDEAVEIFGGDDNQFVDHLIGTHKDDDASGTNGDSEILSGYSKVIGLLCHGLKEHIFPPSTRIYPIVQEFGTVPGVLIFKASRAENAMYHYDPARRSPRYAQDLRDVFYLKDNAVWKDKVISRGQAIFHQLHAYMSRNHIS